MKRTEKNEWLKAQRSTLVRTMAGFALLLFAGTRTFADGWVLYTIDNIEISPTTVGRVQMEMNSNGYASAGVAGSVVITPTHVSSISVAGATLYSGGRGFSSADATLTVNYGSAYDTTVAWEGEDPPTTGYKIVYLSTQVAGAIAEVDSSSLLAQAQAGYDPFSSSSSFVNAVAPTNGTHSEATLFHSYAEQWFYDPGAPAVQVTAETTAIAGQSSILVDDPETYMSQDTAGRSHVIWATYTCTDEYVGRYSGTSWGSISRGAKASVSGSGVSAAGNAVHESIHLQ